MNGTGYRILGYAVWHGGKWYLARRLPRPRAIALSAFGLAGALSAAALIARQLGD
jgi:hypothetical protein